MFLLSSARWPSCCKYPNANAIFSCLIKHRLVLKIFNFIFQRQVYLWNTLYDQFIPEDAPRGGCDGSVIKACTIIFNALMDFDTDG